MAERPNVIHVDDDWKKQAAEEKRRLAEQEKQSQAAAMPRGAASAAGPAARAAGEDLAQPERVADFAALVRSIYTEFLFAVGRITIRGVPPSVDLDRAKYQLDLLAVLEQKTAGNLTAEEKSMLDTILMEARQTFVSLASEYAELP